MKKKFLITAIIAVAFIILNINTSKAATYYKDGFSVTLPDEYDTVITDSASEIDKRTSDYTKEISFESEKYDWGIVIDNNYLDILAGTLSELGFDVKSKKLVEHDGSKGARVGLEVTYSGMGMYMTEYQFLSDNYLYTITFIAFDSNPISANTESTVLNSFKIKDTVKLSNGIPFTDVSRSNWSYSAVKYVYENKIMSGSNSYTFAPNSKVTRGMLVTMLHNMENKPYVAGTSKFSDVKNTKEYYYVAVKWAAKNNIVSGYSNGKFGPNDPITREQLAVILNNYCRYKGKYKAIHADFTKFKDSDKISSYAKWGMNWAVGNKIINGSNGNLNPQGTATRAEAAAMLSNYCKTIK